MLEKAYNKSVKRAFEYGTKSFTKKVLKDVLNPLKQYM